MLYSTYYHKDTNEDNKTSAIFENLMLLPDNIFWTIIRQSCFSGENLPQISGILLSCDFWPHWDYKETKNKRYVEPDVFIRFQQFDVIIEAKYGDMGGQYLQQWRNEVTAYLNEYKEDNKDLFFIAIGGNTNLIAETIKVHEKEVPVIKCTWLSLLMSITKYQRQLINITMPDHTLLAQKRLLDNIKLAFNINGVYDIKWFGDLANNNTAINPNSINILKNKYQYE
ncbi:MAG: hypothetical protein KBT27_01125 [Prevotellaceae bacterium]|nr:hypothetical protein [Candidatus Faecinaster equi]